MKNGILLFLLAFLVSMYVFGQENLRLNVCDALSQKGIPYATVKVLNKPEGVYANEEGIFLIKALQSDSLLVSCVGYKPEKLILSKNDTIFLQPFAVALDEVKVSAKKRKEKSFGYYNTKKKGNLGSPIQIEVAIKLTIPPELISYRVKKVKIKCENRNNSNLVRLHIYSRGKDGLPDKELLPNDIIVNDCLKKNDEIDLSNLNLVLSDRELFIGIEWIEPYDKPRSSFYDGIRIGFSNVDPENNTINRSLRDINYQWRNDFKGQDFQNLMVSLVID